MNKREISKILARADAACVRAMADAIKAEHEAVVVKAPEKSLTMIQLRDPVKETLFYLGEVIVSEAVVELEGAKGTAVVMGDDFNRVLDMAVIDAACNRGVFRQFAELERLAKEQELAAARENALFLKTMVNFTSMDSEASQ